MSDENLTYAILIKHRTLSGGEVHSHSNCILCPPVVRQSDFVVTLFSSNTRRCSTVMSKLVHSRNNCVFCPPSPPSPTDRTTAVPVVMDEGTYRHPRSMRAFWFVRPWRRATALKSFLNSLLSSWIQWLDSTAMFRVHFSCWRRSAQQWQRQALK